VGEGIRPHGAIFPDGGASALSGLPNPLPVSAAPSGKIPDDGKLFSLSPWERVGVRASGRTVLFSRYD